MRKPKILITNDDGIFSDGIYALWEAINQIGNTFIVAPKKNQSGSSHSITLHDPLQIQYFNRINGFEGWAINGTPADCVKIAIKSIMEDKPDLLVSGINRGANLGTNIIYSGTVSAAMEGTLNGIPSMAISLDSFKTDKYDVAKYIAVDLSNYIIENGLPQGTLLNINVPYCDANSIKGKKITMQGTQSFIDEFERRTDPRNRDYFWIKGKIIDKDTSIDYDGKAVKENYVSITPIHSTIINTEYINELKKYFPDE